jgi:hypothetical protein
MRCQTGVTYVRWFLKTDEHNLNYVRRPPTNFRKPTNERCFPVVLSHFLESNPFSDLKIRENVIQKVDLILKTMRRL